MNCKAQAPMACATTHAPVATQGAKALLQPGLAPWPFWHPFSSSWGGFPLFTTAFLRHKAMQKYQTRACSLSHLYNFFFNTQCRQISILLNWHQKECLKVNKELCLQSGSLCLWNKCLFSLRFVAPGDKSHFGQRTQTEIYGMDSSVTWWANVSIPPPILFNNWTFTVQSLPESGFLIKTTLRRKGPNLHTGNFFLLGCTFAITASLSLSEHASDIMSQRN